MSRYRSKSAFFRRVGNFKRKFHVEGDIPTNLCLYEKTRVITLSCGIKILAVCSFVSAQSTRVTDKQMDGQTDRDRITIPKTELAPLFQPAFQKKSFHGKVGRTFGKETPQNCGL